MYKKAGRKELLENETKEIEVISAFLPKQLSEAELKNEALRHLEHLMKDVEKSQNFKIKTCRHQGAK